MEDGAVGRPHEDWAVVIDVDDLHQEHGGAPERGLATICGHHRQVEALIGLQRALCDDKTRVRVHIEGL